MIDSDDAAFAPNSRWGAACAVVLGVCFFAIGMLLLVDPSVPYRMGTAPFYEAIAAQPLVTGIRHALYGVVGLIGLAVVPAVGRWVRPDSPAWLTWAERCGLLAFAVTALDSFRLAVLIPKRAVTFVGADAATQQMIGATELIVRLDPYTWIRFGALALWFGAIALALVRSERAARGLAAIAAVLGVLLLATVVCLTAEARTLVKLVSMPSVLLLPVWFGWMGIRLWKDADVPAPSATA